MTTIESESTHSNNEKEAISLGKRLLMAAGLFILLGGGGAILAIGGLLMMAFSTDSCSGLPDWTTYYLGAWPFIIGLAAIIPPILIVAKVRWLWVLIVAAAGFGISIIWLIGWFPIIFTVC